MAIRLPIAYLKNLNKLYAVSSIIFTLSYHKKKNKNIKRTSKWNVERTNSNEIKCNKKLNFTTQQSHMIKSTSCYTHNHWLNLNFN